MDQALTFAIFGGLAALILVLGWGLWTMFRGGNPGLSQKLMRARVIIQFVVLLLLLAGLYFFGRP